MEGQLKTTQPKWEGLENTNDKMDNLVNFINDSLKETYDYFPPNGIKPFNLSNSIEIYATQQLGINLQLLINYNYTFEYFNINTSEYDNYSTKFKEKFYNSNNIMDKKTIIGKLLVDIYERIKRNIYGYS